MSSATSCLSLATCSQACLVAYIDMRLECGLLHASVTHRPQCRVYTPGCCFIPALKWVHCTVVPESNMTCLTGLSWQFWLYIVMASLQ